MILRSLLRAYGCINICRLKVDVRSPQQPTERCFLKTYGFHAHVPISRIGQVSQGSRNKDESIRLSIAVNRQGSPSCRSYHCFDFRAVSSFGAPHCYVRLFAFDSCSACNLSFSEIRSTASFVNSQYGPIMCPAFFISTRNS